ncbi:HD-GYP domain-containing protein [Pseudodesulfovibrio sp. zrk46]|uniref:HD-GYP domain-containing protein n=1 Tax=Pseudodesulfovibrio sp. zrk46 TaxID=2725288 RepID=UPI0014493D4D|nr:HD-GYP domain-containing protein [Pseudodesulfovibrio sp. zrk46]QJB55876.1 HD-GYP domain-containing protein [Pseudodesulfovibrio sp. zrk46]
MSDINGRAMSAEEARRAMMNDPEELRGTTPVDDEPAASPSEAPVTLQVEMRHADKLYGEAVNYAKGFMDDVRDGKTIDVNEAMPLVNEFIDSVFRNDSAAAAICKLRAFDEYTYTHCINVSILSVILAKKLGYTREQLEVVGMAGMFHDVGKAIIPNSILNKPGKLTDDEMKVMRTHPLHSYKILSAQKDIPEDVIRGAVEHHEKYDGSGYPRGLKGEQISEIARLLAVVDVYDALTSRRVYKDPMPPSKVLAMMYKWRVTDFHPNTVEQFIKSLGVYPVGSFVRLTSGDHGVVILTASEQPLKPTVRVVYDRKIKQIPMKDIDLSKEKRLKVDDVVNPDDHGVDVFRLIQ